MPHFPESWHVLLSTWIRAMPCRESNTSLPIVMSTISLDSFGFYEVGRTIRLSGIVAIALREFLRLCVVESYKASSSSAVSYLPSSPKFWILNYWRDRPSAIIKLCSSGRVHIDTFTHLSLPHFWIIIVSASINVFNNCTNLLRAECLRSNQNIRNGLAKHYKSRESII